MKAFLLLLAAALAAKIKILSPASLVAELSAIRPNAELKGSDANFGHIPYGKTVVRLYLFLIFSAGMPATPSPQTPTPPTPAPRSK